MEKLPVHFKNHKPFWDSDFNNYQVELFLTDLIDFCIEFDQLNWKPFLRSDFENYLNQKNKNLNLSIFYALVDGGSPDNYQSSVEYQPNLIERIQQDKFKISNKIIKSLIKYII